jgi:hypothetical protein
MLPTGIEMIAPNVNANYRKICDQYHNLIKICFQNDITRTVSLLYGHGNQAFSLARAACTASPTATRRCRWRTPPSGSWR